MFAMSTPIYYISNEPLVVRTNGLGIAGFVISLASLLTCGLTSPIGMLISLVAMRKRPRGMATAGFLIGGLQTGLLIGAVLLSVSTGQAIQHQPEHSLHTRKTQDAMAEARDVVERYRADEERLPEGIEGNKLVVPMEDSWGEALRYERRGDGYLIRSAGPDGVFESPDDLTAAEVPQPVSHADSPADMPPLPEIRVR